MAVGKLEKKDISHRCAVWSEPSVVEAAAYEFAQTEDFLKIAEEISGKKYVWGRYDLLCLPGSFPFGGKPNDDDGVDSCKSAKDCKGVLNLTSLFLCLCRHGKSMLDFCHPHSFGRRPIPGGCCRARDWYEAIVIERAYSWRQ